jgi:hypothetical protein
MRVPVQILGEPPSSYRAGGIGSLSKILKGSSSIRSKRAALLAGSAGPRPKEKTARARVSLAPGSGFKAATGSSIPAGRRSPLKQPPAGSAQDQQQQQAQTLPDLGGLSLANLVMQVNVFSQRAHAFAKPKVQHIPGHILLYFYLAIFKQRC